MLTVHQIIGFLDSARRGSTKAVVEVEQMLGESHSTHGAPLSKVLCSAHLIIGVLDSDQESRNHDIISLSRSVSGEEAQKTLSKLSKYFEVGKIFNTQGPSVS